MIKSIFQKAYLSKIIKLCLVLATVQVMLIVALLVLYKIVQGSQEKTVTEYGPDFDAEVQRVLKYSQKGRNRLLYHLVDREYHDKIVDYIERTDIPSSHLDPVEIPGDTVRFCDYHLLGMGTGSLQPHFIAATITYYCAEYLASGERSITPVRTYTWTRAIVIDDELKEVVQRHGYREEGDWIGRVEEPYAEEIAELKENSYGIHASVARRKAEKYFGISP